MLKKFSEFKAIDEVKYVPGFVGADGKATSKPTAKDFAANKEYQHMKKKLGDRIPGPKPTKEGIIDAVKSTLSDLKKSVSNFHKTDTAAQIRKNKTTKTMEEVEAVNELSKKTLGSYIKKATDDKENEAYHSGGDSEDNHLNSSKRNRQVDKRNTGIHKALKKLGAASGAGPKLPKADSSKYKSHLPKPAKPEKKLTPAQKAAKQKKRDALMALTRSYMPWHNPHLNKEETTKTMEGTQYTDKEVRMGKGVAFDKRYRDGNYTGAYKTIEKIKKGLAKHPKVADALKRANESKLLSMQEVAGQRGRPKRGEDAESDKHIIMQLRSAQDLGGNKHITFRGGKQHKVHLDHINKILKAHDHPSMKPVHKRMLRVAISKGPEHLARVAKAIKH